MLNEQPHSFRDNPYSALLGSGPSSNQGITEFSPPHSLEYDDKDYEIANNIFQEAMLQSSSKLAGGASVHSTQGDPHKIDRMQLMKAYETILRSEGILPVTDSKIYNLVFKVFQKCEKALHNESQMSKHSDSSDFLQESLNRIREKSEQMQKAIAYHEFRLQNRVFEAIRIILDMKISNDKENMHADQKQMGFGTQNKIYINEPSQTLALGSRHQNDINLPRTLEIQSTKQGGVPVKHFSFKEELNNSNSQQNIQSQVTESHTNISALQDHQPIRNNSKVSLPPRDTKKPTSQSGITSYAKHLNNNSSSDLNSQGGYMNINVHPSPSNESLAMQNQVLKPQIYQTQQQQRRHSNQHENNMTHRYPESTKHRPSATQHFIDPNQSSITQIPASSSGIMSQSFTYYPIRQPRNSLQQDNLISDSSVSMFGGGGPTMKQEDDYVLLVKFMRKWQQGVSIIKRERDQQRIMQEKLYLAARYHVHSLRTKGLLSFIKYRIIMNREREQLEICQGNVQHNILRFYFKMFTNKYRERIWIKSGNNIATLFKSNQTLRKVLQAWSQQVKHQILKVNRIRKVFQRNIKPVQILIDMIGGFYTQQSRYNQLDIDQFLRAAFNYWRVPERNKHVFNAMCVRVLTKRLRDIFSAWKSQTQKVISFKNRRLTWIAKKCFRAIKLRSDIKKEVITKAYKILFYLKFKAMLSLRQYTDSKIQLRRKGLKVSKLHRNIVFKNFFGQWHHLFKYYSTMMKDSFVKDNLAKVIFLRKYLKSWQMISQTHRYRRQALQLCACNQYEQVISNCFFQLHNHAKHQRKLKVQAAKISAKHTRKVREIFFVAWIRRSSLEYYSRLVRDKSLKYKLITALQRNVAYKRILRQVEMIAADHYSRQLLNTAWKALDSKRTRQIQLNNVKRVIYREYSLRLMNNCMQALIANRHINHYKKASDYSARAYYQRKLLEKTLYNLHITTVKQRVLNNAFHFISQKRALQSKSQVISRFITKMNTKVGLRLRHESFVSAKALHTMRTVFYGLYNIYYDRLSKLNFLHSKRTLTKQAQLFYTWFNFTNNRAVFKKRFQSILAQRKDKIMEKVFGQFVLYTHQKKLETHFNKIAAFVFFQNLLKKHLRAFKLNAAYKRNLRVSYHIIVQNRFKRLFQGFSRIVTIKKNLAEYIRKKSIQLQNQIFVEWHQEIQNKKVLKAIIAYFTNKRNKQLHQLVFTELHLVAHIGDNLMQQAFKRITHKKRKQMLTQLIMAWKIFTRKFQKLGNLFTQFNSKRSVKQQSQILTQWKENAYYSHFEREQLVPFVNQRRKQNLSKVLNALKYNVNNNENKMNKMNQASMYYYSKMLSKLFNTILQNAIYNQNKALKLQNALAHNESRIVKNAWIIIYNYCVAKQRLQLGYQHIADNHSILVKQKFLNEWITVWNKIQISKEAHRRLSHTYYKYLVGNVFNSLKEQIEYRHAKREAIENLRPFKQQLSRIMESQIKQRYFTDWINSYNDAVYIKQQAILENKVKLAQQHRNMKTMRTAFQNIQDQKRINYKIVHQFNAVERIMFFQQQRQFFDLLQNNYTTCQKAEQFIVSRIPFIKRKVLQQLQLYKNHKKVSNKAQIQAQAFSKLRLLIHGLKSLHQYSNRQKQLKVKYGKISKVYRDQLLSKGLMVLQWNRMRSLYYGSLYTKSINHFSSIIQSKCFNHLKKMLINKYKQVQLQRLRNLKQIEHHWNIWRDRYDIIQELGDEQDNEYLHYI